MILDPTPGTPRLCTGLEPALRRRPVVCATPASSAHSSLPRKCSDLRGQGGSTLETAVRAVASLTAHYLARRDRVGLIGFGGTLRWLVPAAGVVQLYRITEALLDTQAVLSYAWKGIEVIPPRTLPPRALVVAVTPLLDRRSEGFVNLFRMLARELDDEYFQTVEDHLSQLRFRNGVLISAQLGTGNKGVGYVLRRLRRQSWRDWLTGERRTRYTFRIADRDEGGHRALADLKDRGINLVANALAQSTDHILSFFEMLRAELGFYVGCLNLHRQLVQKGEPTCFPVALAAGRPALACRGLYDVCLSLSVEQRVVGNDVEADGRSLVMITGANRGGKSTFLRSLGLAQLMMQSGMFVPAAAFQADVCAGLFTHFKREEDATMRSGKLDEELSRMSDIADSIAPGCVLLCNESFASTNEREGSEIARQIVRALLESGLKVFFVTHMFDLAHGFHEGGGDDALFLRAERLADGRRTFRMIEGEPLPTSHGVDLYRRIFGTVADTAPTGAGHRPELES